MKNENTIKTSSGYLMLVVLFAMIAVMIAGLFITVNALWLILIPVIILTMRGFFTVNPNSSKVLVLFGAYKGTVKANGFFWANPFFTKKKISLRYFPCSQKMLNTYFVRPRYPGQWMPSGWPSRQPYTILMDGLFRT